jgi:hypothetical protein
MIDKRTPKLEKVGCYHWQGDGTDGFHFFERNPNVESRVKNGDVFIYNEGILWKVKKACATVRENPKNP